MPEAPWVKLCAHGITFTNDIQSEDISQAEKEKFKKFFGEPNSVIDGPAEADKMIYKTADVTVS